MRRIGVLFLMLSQVAGCGRAWTPTPAPVATPLDTGEATVSPVPPLPEVLGRVSLNEAFPSAPLAVAVDAATGDLYVVGDGGIGLPGWLAVVHEDVIAATAPVGVEPRAVAVHPRTGRVYVVNHGSDDVSILEGMQAVATVEVGQRPTDVAIDPGTGLVYVSHSGMAPEAGGAGETGAVSILRGTQLLSRVPAGVAPQQIEFHPANGLVYVRNHRQSITVLDGEDLLADIPVELPWSLSAMAVDALGGHVYVACGASLGVVDSTEWRTTLDLGGPPIDALAAGPAAGSLYVAQQGKISVVDDLRVVATLPLEQMPNHLACLPGSGYCYVTGWLDMGDTAMSVIQGTEVITSTWAGSYPNALVADPPRDRVILASDGLTILDGPRIRATVGTPLGVVTAAAAAGAGSLYLVARSPGWPGDRILVVDGLERIASLPTRGSLPAVAVNPVSGLAYVVDRRHGQVLVLSGTDEIATLGVGEAPSYVTANPETGLVYVVNASGPMPGLGAVDVLRGTEWLARVPVGDNPGEVVANPATGYVYVANRGAPLDYPGSVDVLRGTQRLTTLPAGRYPHALVVNPATGYVYAANRESEDVNVYRELAQVATLPLSGRPQDACLDPATGYVYVAEEGDRVAVIRGTQTLAELPVPPRPRTVAADPRSGYVYVAGEGTPPGGSYVTVLRGTEVMTTIEFAGSALSGLVIEADRGWAYLFDSRHDDLVVIGPPAGP
jgi:YVTN family beta-propeller protein